MLELSRWHAIRRDRDLVAAEIDRTLHETFGAPSVPRRFQVFGRGFGHLMGLEIDAYEPPAEYQLTPTQRDVARRLGTEFKRTLLLVGAPPDWKVPGYDPAGHRQVGRRPPRPAQQEQLRGTSARTRVPSR